MRITKEAAERHPGTLVGLMCVSGLDTPPDPAAWNDLKEAELTEFRAAWPDYDRKRAVMSPPLSGYAAYYKQFKKTYQVLLQMESVLLKGRGVRAASPAIEAMFLAEVKQGILASGHDLDSFTNGEYMVDLARGGEELTIVSGERRILKSNDLYLTSRGKILSSVLEGQDYGTRLTETSRNALYCVYAVGGTDAALVGRFFKTLGVYISTALPQAGLHDHHIFE